MRTICHGVGVLALVAPAIAVAQGTPAPDEGVTVKYDKGFVLEKGDEFELKTGIRSQLRLEVNKTEAADEFESKFVVPRLRLQLEGYAFGKRNLYKVEFDMANKGFSLLKDAWVEHAFDPALRVRVGQWKRPFNRQEMVSDFGSEFLERSISNEFAGGGRDLGIAVHNNYEKSPDGLEWAVGVFNGTGERARQTVTCTPGMDPTMDPPTCTVSTPTNAPADFGPMIVARVGFNLGGIKGYSEGDLEGGPFRLAVGASYKVNLADFAKDANDESLMEHAVEADLILKVSGFDLSGALFFVKDGPADGEIGFYAQAGYFVLPKQLQLCARFAQIPAGDEKVNEILGAIDWYFSGHSYKLMFDGGAIQTTGDPGATNLQFRTQLQLVL